MVEREIELQELELQLALAQAAADAYIRKSRRWIVVLTILLGFLAMLATGSTWMGVGVGGMIFIVMWSGLSASVRRQRNQIERIREQISAARRRERDRRWGQNGPDGLLWPGDHAWPADHDRL